MENLLNLIHHNLLRFCQKHSTCTPEATTAGGKRVSAQVFPLLLFSQTAPFHPCSLPAACPLTTFLPLKPQTLLGAQSPSIAFGHVHFLRLVQVKIAS